MQACYSLEVISRCMRASIVTIECYAMYIYLFFLMKRYFKCFFEQLLTTVFAIARPIFSVDPI